jgi:hypothetical protein
MDMQTLAIIILVVNLAVGVVFCFFGNRWLKVILGIFGFSVGFVLANTVLPLISSMSDTALLLVSVGAGAVGALLFILFLYVGIFFIGFGGGMLLCLLLVQALELNLLDWYVYIPVLIICSVLGSLTLNQRRIFVSVFTAYIGASALAQFVDQLVNGVRQQSFVLYDTKAAYSAYTSTVYLIALAGFFLAGLIIQLVVTGKKKS